MAPSPGRSKKVAVYDDLKRRIITCELHPGMPVNEADVARELGVSTTPVREALRQLEQEGFVENVPRRGSIISNISSRDIGDYFALRELLECAAARRAALMKDKTAIEAGKRQILEYSGRSASTPEKVYDWQPWEDVHEVVVKALRNKKLTAVFEGLMDHIKRIRNHVGNPSTARPREELLAEHLEILEAVLQGEPDRAERAIRSHLSNPVSFGVAVVSRPDG